MSLFVLWLGSLAISVVVTAIVRKVASAAGALDAVGDPRKIHERPVPRLGGLAIVLGACGSLALIALLDAQIRAEFLRERTPFLGLAAACLGVVALGVYDDLCGAGAKTKVLVQLPLAILLYVAGFRILVVQNPFGADIVLGVLSLPVTALWIVGLTNAVNLIDGIDGLAAGISVAAAAALAVIGAQAGVAAVVPVAVAIIGSVLGFLVFNVNPASIFMGDTGSLFLGMALAGLSLRSCDVGRSTPLLAFVVVLALPIADTLLAVLRRAARGTPLFRGDREHLHHRLLDKGLSQGQAAMTLWAGAALLAAAGVHVATGGEGRRLVLGVVAASAIAVLGKLGMFDFVRDAFGMTRRRNVARFRAVRRVGSLLQARTGMSDIAKELAAVAPAFDALAFSLRVPGDVAFVTDRLSTERGTCVTRFVLDRAAPELGCLEAEWSGRGTTLDRDAELALQELCRSLAHALRRDASSPGRGVLRPVLSDAGDLASLSRASAGLIGAASGAVPPP